MICPFCENEIENDSVLCPFCGNRVKKEKMNNQKEEDIITVPREQGRNKQACSGMSKGKYVVIGVIMIVAILFGVGIGKVISNDSAAASAQNNEYVVNDDIALEEADEQDYIEYDKSEKNEIDNNENQKGSSYQEMVKEKLELIQWTTTKFLYYDGCVDYSLTLSFDKGTYSLMLKEEDEDSGVQDMYYHSFGNIEVTSEEEGVLIDLNTSEEWSYIIYYIDDHYEIDICNEYGEEYHLYDERFAEHAG